jgi:hypothetical protein
MKAILTDGVKQQVFSTRNKKGLDVWNDETPGAWLGIQEPVTVSLVPAVQSAWQARCKAIADLPFTIYGKGDNEVDNSDEYKNVCGFLPNPRNFLWLTEAALVGYGKAYWLKRSNVYKVTKEMQYFVPTSVTEILDTTGLVRFERNNGKNTAQYKPDDILYTWLPDPSVEIGPPTVYPLASALLSAKALELINVFIKNYMERGAVKALLLAAKNMPSEEEANRVETWFNKFMRGVTNLKWKVFDAEAITPTIVGEGLEAFKGITVVDDLTRQIHTAMGTRHMLEDENYATADVRQREFYTNTIVPEARIIGDALNQQMLQPLGYRIEFNPERLEVFGDDEAANMTAFGTLAGSLTSASPEVVELSLSLAGVVLTEEQQAMLDAIKATKEENKQKLEEQMNKPATSTDNETATDPKLDKQAQDLEKWQRKAIKRIGKDVPFTSDAIPESVQDCIHQALADCKCEDDIKTLFQSHVGTSEVVEEFQKIIQPDYSHLIEAMRMETQYIKSMNVQQPIKIYNNLKDVMSEDDMFKPTINVTVQPTPVTINVPEQPPAQITVNVPPAQITIPKPQINVTVPEQKAPVVNIKMPRIKKSKQSVKRDPQSREIISTETSNEYEDE